MYIVLHAAENKYLRGNILKYDYLLICTYEDDNLASLLSSNDKQISNR